MMDLPDELLLPLRRPLVTAKGEVSTLSLREPTAGEIDKFTRTMAREGNIAAMLGLITAVSGIDKPLLEKLGARDFVKASEYLDGFMAASPKTGETQSQD